jgi:hypothetical protein
VWLGLNSLLAGGLFFSSREMIDCARQRHDYVHSGAAAFFVSWLLVFPRFGAFPAKCSSVAAFVLASACDYSFSAVKENRLLDFNHRPSSQQQEQETTQSSENESSPAWFPIRRVSPKELEEKIAAEHALSRGRFSSPDHPFLVQDREEQNQ